MPTTQQQAETRNIYTSAIEMTTTALRTQKILLHFAQRRLTNNPEVLHENKKLPEINVRRLPEDLVSYSSNGKLLHRVNYLKSNCCSLSRLSFQVWQHDIPELRNLTAFTLNGVSFHNPTVSKRIRKKEH